MAGVKDAVTLVQFLKVLFGESPRGIVDLVTAEPGRGGAVFFIDHNKDRWEGPAGPHPLYVCISTCEAVGPRSRKPSRKHPVATYVIVLDDVGTKVRVEKLPAGLRPTYALETSPGNFQIGFRFRDAVEPARAAALIEALSAAGFTDPGAKSDVRLVRVPGSLNGKPSAGDWRARLTTWNPDVAYTFSELATLFGVVPADTSPRAGVPELAPGQVDPTADWAVAHAGAVGGASGPAIRGLIPILCPQHHLHTVGTDRSNDSSTVWIPGSPGAFHCTHGHCVGFRTREYLQWICDNYPGNLPAAPTRPDLEGLGAAIRRAQDAIADGGGMFQPVSRPPQEALREFIVGDLVKVGSKDRYFSLSGREYLTRAGVDDAWKQRLFAAGLLNALTPAAKTPTVILPQEWLRRQPDVRRVAKVVHRLGWAEVVEAEDALNIAAPVPARPVASGEPTPWLELLEHLCGGDAGLVDLIIDWFAMVVGCWDEKPGWHVLMRGPQGTGKNLIAEPLRRWLGDHHQRVEVSKIGGDFHPFLMRRLCTIDEIKMTTRGATTMHDIYTSLKAWTTRGNATVDINIKNGEINALDLSCWLLTSNEGVPMPLDDDDRRFLVVDTPPKMDTTKYREFIAWGEAGGYAQTVGWLCQQWDALGETERDALRGPAPMTDAKRRMIDGSAEGIPGAVKLATSGVFGTMWPELMTLSDAVDDLRIGRASSYLPDAYRRQLSEQRVAMAMRAVGWVQLFGGQQARSGSTRVRLWCRTAQRAVLYEQLNQGKKVVEAYQKMKATGGQAFGDDLTRAEFNPFGVGGGENEK
jgi:hypothetical protein